MGVVADSGVIEILDLINDPLSVFGISNPLYEKVMEADFESTPVEQQAAAIAAGVEILKSAAAEFAAMGIDDDIWSGEPKAEAVEIEHCTVGFSEMLADMYIMLVEIVIQVIDYILDIIRWIVIVVGIVLGLLIAIVTVALAAAAWTAGASFVAGAVAAASALGGGVAATVILIASILVIAAILLWLIDMFVEWIQDLLSSAREKGCLKGEAPLPDFDPPKPGTPW